MGRHTQDFLKSFFNENPTARFLEVNGFILEQHPSAGLEGLVMIYTKESWRKKESFLALKKSEGERNRREQGYP